MAVKHQCTGFAEFAVSQTRCPVQHAHRKCRAVAMNKIDIDNFGPDITARAAAHQKVCAIALHDLRQPKVAWFKLGKIISKPICQR